MKHLPLKEITFGKVDAETEVTIDQGRYFDRVYLDPFDCLKRVREGEFIIHGRKGTGKSAFSYYLQRQSSPNLFSHKLHYSMKEVEQIVQMPELNNANEAHVLALWEWIFLCVMGKFVLDDQSINLGSTHRAEFDRFYKINQGYCSPGALELKQQIASEKNEIRIAALNRLLQAKGITEIEATNGKAHFMKLLGPLKELLATVLQSSFRDKANEYFIVIDNLDHGYTGSKIQKMAIIALLRSAKGLFTRFHEMGVRLFPVILIRTDMLVDLMYEADTNKMLHANSLKLNWYDHDMYVDDEKKVPLRNLIASRVEYSYAQKGQSLSQGGWEVLFRDWDAEKNSFKYLVDKTLYRPRDLIYLFDCLKEKYGDRNYISKDMVDNISSAFGEYMIGEWKNELSAHYTSDQIENLFESLKQFCDRQFFGYKDFSSISLKSQALNHKQLLEVAYDFGLVCIYLLKDGRPFYVWSHRPPKEEELESIDESSEFSIHYSFRDHFKSKRRRLFG